MEKARYQRLFISMRYWLLGAAEYDVSYFHSLNALEYAKSIHIGMRKNKTTPEFQHQVEIGLFIRTMNRHMIFPADTLAVCFLHDTLEDYAIEHNISIESLELRFNHRIAQATWNMSKIHNGIKLSNENYYDNIASCPISSIAKGVDRINNISTMHPVFNLKKQRDYIQETIDFVLPMLKKARHLHPEQEAIYENIKFVLNNFIKMTNDRLDISENYQS